MAKAARIYATIDVNYFDDDRVIEAGDAWQLHFAAILACRRTMNDGRLTLRQLTRIAPDSLPDVGEAISQLLAIGLFIEDGDGVIVRAWAEWNDSAEDIEAMAKGGSYGNHVRWHVKKRVKKEDCEWCFSPPESPPDRPAIRVGESTRIAHRPDQTRPDQIVRGASEAPAPKPRRGARLSADFAVTDPMREWARTHDIRSSLEAETEKFIDHFRAKGEAKQDWVAAWRNWMRRADQWAPASKTNGSEPVLPPWQVTS